ncbi:unnamed protein product [Dovyalis caffra]|uniref:Uncharacterized protein n=1 Tax=Dovyalis caffra TaxID=77055 RepID=A0AAV1RZC5_9ROSI|nr:unnamed protein product [Dovyalis caffra]
MDSLIKGLMDVVLDHLGQKDDESHNERSRSSWAQSEGRRNEEWQTEDSRPSRRPQKGMKEMKAESSMIIAGTSGIERLVTGFFDALTHQIS